MKVPILYEDNHLLLVEKPVNIPLQSDKSGDQDLLSHLKTNIKIRFQKPGNVYLGMVHRLDRPVGGAMVFAKTSKAASRLSDQVRRNSMERQYHAVVHGQPPKKADQLVDYLWKDTQQNIVYIVPQSHQAGKKARLNYQVLETQGGLSLLAVQLETGVLIKFVCNLQAWARQYGETKNMVRATARSGNKLLCGPVLYV